MAHSAALIFTVQDENLTSLLIGRHLPKLIYRHPFPAFALRFFRHRDHIRLLPGCRPVYSAEERYAVKIRPFWLVLTGALGNGKQSGPG
jgi:hypothetical protein